MRNRLIPFVFVLALLSGCSTISFHSSKNLSASYDVEEWHHTGIFGLVEFSDAVDLSSRCEGKPWRSVKTEIGFLQGLVGGLTGSLYTPLGVEVACQ